MGLLDIFGGDKVKKWRKRLVERYGPPENRAKAIDELEKMDTPEAFAALLTRFDAISESSITDKEEKERVFQILIDAGGRCVEAIREHLLHGVSVAYPARALSQLVSREVYVGTLLEALDRIGPGYVRDPSKKLELLKHVASEKDARIAPALTPYLEDVDDAVKIAASEAITAQQDPNARDALIQFLLAHAGEKRVQAAAAAALAATGFDVKGHSDQVRKALPPGWELTKDGKVRKR